MKNILWTLVFVALTGSAFAETISKKTLTFWTQGIDRYADGTQVLDNEQYALVYVTPGQSVGGFYTDGSLINTTNNQLVCKLPAALNGKCTEQQVQFYPSLITKAAGGKFVVVMLDTRLPSTETTRTLGELVMGWGVAGEASGVSSATTVLGEVAVQQAAQVSGNAQLPVDVGAPLISGIEVKGDKVVVTVKKVSPKANYELNATDDVKKDKSQWARSFKAQRGASSGTMELEYPVADGSKLFKVVIPVK
ncbi:MAG: hypothetical protein WCP12_07740 [bacterium]